MTAEPTTRVAPETPPPEGEGVRFVDVALAEAADAGATTQDRPDRPDRADDPVEVVLRPGSQRDLGIGATVVPVISARVRPMLAPQAGRAWNGHERRSPDPIKRLSRDFDALCTAAVDAAEIAAGLEAVGFTDGMAGEYGLPDVFALSDRLFHLTPRSGKARPGKLANPWAERPGRHLVRGIAFAAPGLLFIACLPHATALADRIALSAAMLIGWPAGQAMAFVGHLLEGRRHPAGARALLLSALALLIATAAGFVAVARWAGVQPAANGLAAGEIVYLAAATVVLVLGHERLALAVLVPGVATATLALPTHLLPGRLAVAGAALSVVAAVLAAVSVALWPRWRDLRSGLAALVPDDWHDAGWQFSYGVAGALLVTLPSVSGLHGAVVSSALIPVIWSMGLAEWQIVRLRRRSFGLLNEAISMALFRRQVARLLASSAGRYLAGLSMLTLILPVAGLAGVTRRVPSQGLIGLGFGWSLGAAFFLGLILSSMGRIRVVVAALTAGVIAGGIALTTAPVGVALQVAPLLACLLLLRPVFATVADPTRHM